MMRRRTFMAAASKIRLDTFGHVTFVAEHFPNNAGMDAQRIHDALAILHSTYLHLVGIIHERDGDSLVVAP